MAQISWNHWHVRIAIILKIPTLHFSKHCTNPTQLPLWLICFQEKSLFAAWNFQWRACQRQKSRSFFGKYTRYVQTISCCSTHPFDKWNWHISGLSVLSVYSLPYFSRSERLTCWMYIQIDIQLILAMAIFFPESQSISKSLQFRKSSSQMWFDDLIHQFQHIHNRFPMMSCKLQLCVAVEGPTQHLTCEGWSNAMDFTSTKSTTLKRSHFFSQSYKSRKGQYNGKSSLKVFLLK